MGSMRSIAVLGVLAMMLCGVRAGAGTLTPEETVRRYLQSMKDQKADAAYDLVSKAMRGGKGRAQWVKDQAEGMAFAEVKIFDFEVFPAKIEGDKAFVPNVLSSQDRFVNQLGLTEHELYTLVREDGAWKVDEQLIVEPPDIPKWFTRAEKGPTPGGTASPSAPGPPH